MEQTLLISAVLGGIAKPLIDLIINSLEQRQKHKRGRPKKYKLSTNDKQIISVLICVLLGSLVAVGEGLLIGETTPQNLVINLATVISVSQAVHNYTKGNERI